MTVLPDPPGVSSRLLLAVVVIAGLVPVKEIAVPLAELVSTPDILRVVTDDTAPELITMPFMVFTDVGPTNAPPEVIEDVPVVVIVPLVLSAPEVLMVNCPVEPTESNCVGLVLPIPTLPFANAVNAVVPPAANDTLPVVADPKVRVCALVVPSVPAPVR